MGLLADKLAGHSFAMPQTESPVFLALLEGAKRGISETRAHEIVKQAYARRRGLKLNDDGEISAAVSTDQPINVEPSSPHASGSPARPTLNLAGDVATNARNILAQSVFDRCKTSTGKSWGDVGAHELDGMDRDGTMARAIKNRLGALSNQQRFMTIRELMRPEIFEQVRSEAYGS